MKQVGKTIINGQVINFNRIYHYLEDLFYSNVHANRIVSMANAVLGVITSASLAISMIGFGLAVAKGKDTKHSVKQVDRLIGNKKFAVWSCFENWVNELIGLRMEIIVAMDWTSFDKDNRKRSRKHIFSMIF